MKHLIILLTILIITIPTSAQQKKSPEHYSYPFDMSYQPLTVRANIILLYRSDGEGNFDMNDPEQKSLLYDYNEVVNQVYSDIKSPVETKDCYKGDVFYPDSKIRIKFNYVKVKNTYAWNYLNSGSVPEEKKFIGFSPSESWYIKSLDDSISAAKDIPKGINVYLTTNGEKFDEIVRTKAKIFDVAGQAAGQLPTERNLKRSSQIHNPNRYVKYLLHKYQAPIQSKTTWEVTRTWHLSDAMGFAHEFGHDFGLSHSNEYHNTNQCGAALMSYAKPLITEFKQYIEPTEIKRMHSNLTRTNLMQFVTPESHYGVTWTIDKDTIWDKPRRFYNNFEIAKGVTLTISDSIILPPQSFIKLNKKSKIILQGKGKITNAFGQEYKNFDKHRTAAIIRE